MIDVAVIVAVICGFGQVFKQFIGSKYMPIVSLVLGVSAGLAFIDGSVQEQVFIGLSMGLAASGAFDVANIPKKKSEKEGNVK